MLHLLYGRAGSGKTTVIRQAIKEDVAENRQAILLVPEQLAYTTERDLLSLLPPSAGLCFSVLTFSSLAATVFRQYGGLGGEAPGEGVLSLLMWENLRNLSPTLCRFGGKKLDGAMASLMLKTVEEFRANGVDIATMDTAIRHLPKNSTVTDKLKDLCAVSAGYEMLLSDICKDVNTDPLALLASLLKEHRCFSGVHVYVDAFSSFTAEEMRILREILRSAACVTVSLCCEGRGDRKQEGEISFASIADAARKLRHLADQCSTECRETLLTGNHRAKSSTLSAIEQGLWNFAKQTTKVQPDGSVSLFACGNAYAEAEAVAVQILDLVQKGYAFRDILVVARDASSYQGILDAALEKYNIPCFLSEKTQITASPLARLILSALRAVCRGYRTADILTLLKTGLLQDLHGRDLDLFEEYITMWNLHGRAFSETEPFTRSPDGYREKTSKRGAEILAIANRAKETLMPPLRRLQKAIKAAKTIPDYCRAVCCYLEDTHADKRLASMAGLELSLGQKKEAGETLRVHDVILSTLADMSRTLPNSALSAEEFITALTLVFSQNEMASVPMEDDCVVIGSASTLRAEGVKVAMLVGVCEGEFPASVSDAGLFTESDKSILSEVGIALDSRSDRLSAEELLYFYRAVTAPSDKLYLFYPLFTAEGRPKTPSIAFARIKHLSGEKVNTVDLSLLARAKAAASLCNDILPASTNETPTASALPSLQNSTALLLTEPQEILLPSVLQSAFGQDLHLTQSKLASFDACPYRFYLETVLHLRDKKTGAYQENDAGSFLHRVMERTVPLFFDADGNPVALRDETVSRVVDRVVVEYLNTLLPGFATQAEGEGRLLHLFGRLRALSLLLLASIRDETKHCRFLPSFYELPIGGTNGPLPLRLPLFVSKEELPKEDAADEQKPLAENNLNPSTEKETVFSRPLCLQPEPETLPQITSLTPYSPPILSIPPANGRHVFIEGTVDRVDVYLRGQSLYLRVVDYKSGNKKFEIKKLESGQDFQLFLYLFTLCSAENANWLRGCRSDIRRWFAEFSAAKHIQPAGALYLSTARDTKENRLKAARSGLLRQEHEILCAMDNEDDPRFLGDIKKTDDGFIGKGLLDPTGWKDLRQTITNTVTAKAENILMGKAEKTPTPTGCRYCAYRFCCSRSRAERQ